MCYENSCGIGGFMGVINHCSTLSVNNDSSLTIHFEPSKILDSNYSVHTRHLHVLLFTFVLYYSFLSSIVAVIITTFYPVLTTYYLVTYLFFFGWTKNTHYLIKILYVLVSQIFSLGSMMIGLCPVKAHIAKL